MEKLWGRTQFLSFRSRGFMKAEMEEAKGRAQEGERREHPADVPVPVCGGSKGSAPVMDKPFFLLPRKF